MAGKHLFGANGGLLIQNPRHNTVISQQSHVPQQTYINAVQNLTNSQDYFWQFSKYTREEVEMAIGQEAIGLMGNFIVTIAGTTPSRIITTDLRENFLLPESINKIPYIDKLRKTKLFKLVENGNI